jgi:small subunit ribosomal protein S16
VGRKKQATFRIVVAGSMHARGGRMTENIGKYNPRTQPSYIEIDEKRALYWLRQGAKMSVSVESLFRKGGILKKLADGADGEGVVRIGDPQGKTLHPASPSKAKAKPKAAEEEAAPAEAAAEEKAPEAAEKAEAAAEKAEEPEAAAEKTEEPEAAAAEGSEAEEEPTPDKAEEAEAEEAEEKK